MQGIIFLAGDVPRTALGERLIHDYLGAGATLILAADAGAHTSQVYGLKPDFLLGDFDSLDAVVLEELKKAGTFIKRYPSRKNATDGELVLDSALELKCERLLIFSGLGPLRPDHFLMNLELMLKLKRSGIDCQLSDGKSLLVALYGKEELNFSFTKEFAYRPYVSTLSFVKPLLNLRYEGLAYPLDQDLQRGSSLGISNYPSYFDHVSENQFQNNNSEAWRFAISMDSGEGLLMICPQD